MELFGYQVDAFLALDVGLIVLLLLAAFAVHVGLRKWNHRRAQAAEETAMNLAQRTLRRRDELFKVNAKASSRQDWFPLFGRKRNTTLPTDKEVSQQDVQDLEEMVSRVNSLVSQAIAEANRRAQILRVANVVSTVIVLIPIAAAIYSLVFGSPHVALQFDLIGVAVLAVKAVAGWVLTALLIPIVNAALPAAVKQFGDDVGAGVGRAAAKKVNKRIPGATDK